MQLMILCSFFRSEIPTCFKSRENKLCCMGKDMMEEAQIKGFYTNHSLRAATATRLFQANIPEQLIKAQTGHRSDAVRGYKRPSQAQLQDVSTVIQNKIHKRHCAPGPA